MSELHGAIEKAFVYLNQAGADIPVDLLIAARMKGVKAGYAEGGVPAITARYNNEIIAALTAFFEGGSVTAPRNRFNAAMVEAFNSAFDTGWIDGGGDFPLDDKARTWLINRVGEESAHIVSLFEQARELRKDAEFDFFAWSTNRADAYSSSVLSVYNAAVMLVKGNGMLTWHLGDTEKHCGTCLSLNGGSHHASWYIDRDYIPRKPGAAMDCGGWNCDCSLTDKAGNVVTI